MICDKLENLPCYRGMLPALDRVIDFVQDNDPFALPLGRTEIDGDTAFVNVMEPTFQPAESAKWECHERYADLQLALADGETIAYLPTDSVRDWQAYRPENDIAQSDDTQMGCISPLSAGMFAIYFPWDGHKPGIGSIKGKKAVFKLKML